MRLILDIVRDEHYFVLINIETGQDFVLTNKRNNKIEYVVKYFKIERIITNVY